MKSFIGLFAAAACATLLVATPTAHAEEIRGAGSTFAQPIISKWVRSFRAVSGHVIEYEWIGSTRGISQLKEGSVDFAASDKPLKPGELQKLGLVQFPIVVGGIVPVVHIDGIEAGTLKLTGSVLTDIYLGKLTNWSDPAIKSLNPGLSLPNAKIAVVHRLDGSGTTYNWTAYLADMSPDWSETVGVGTSIEWPVGTGANGNEGVALAVQQVMNSIGYIEYSFAVKLQLAHALVQNAAGGFVGPDMQGFEAATASADWDEAKDFYAMIGDSHAEGAYPLAAATFILMYKKPKSPARSKAALEFFRFALTRGREDAAALDYAPLPESLVRQVETYWTRSFGS